jgi:hypothetical protein
MRRKILLALILIVIGMFAIGFAQVPAGWEKVSGLPAGYSGVPDGILGDRQNSYAWSMEVFGDYLYVGTSRNVFAAMLSASGMGFLLQAPQIPMPADMRGRIFRMHLQTHEWESFYMPPPIILSGQPIMGIDSGYRMMRAFRAQAKKPVLYIGSVGSQQCRLLAVLGQGVPTRVFCTTKTNKILSIRAIAEHENQLFWASEDSGGPALWYSHDPYGEFQANPNVQFGKIQTPPEWFVNGAEIIDMVSYDDALYVFWLPYDVEESGFWCAKLHGKKGMWKWELIVGDLSKGAKYPAGMGRRNNGAAVPVVFKGKVYVGTLDGAAFRMMNGMITPGPMGNPVDMMGGAIGMQIFRFDHQDNWERVMPAAWIGESQEPAYNGFGNPLNKYIWRFGIQEGRLYAGTFDIGTGLNVIYSAMHLPPPSVITTPLGFDLYSTKDGLDWSRETLTGFDDPFNYGARSFAKDPETGDLYLGTANPFYGCQVWKKASSELNEKEDD